MTAKDVAAAMVAGDQPKRVEVFPAKQDRVTAPFAVRRHPKGRASLLSDIDQAIDRRDLDARLIGEDDNDGAGISHRLDAGDQRRRLPLPVPGIDHEEDIHPSQDMADGGRLMTNDDEDIVEARGQASFDNMDDQRLAFEDEELLGLPQTSRLTRRQHDALDQW